jgi:ribose transport system permease protein
MIDATQALPASRAPRRRRLLRARGIDPSVLFGAGFFAALLVANLATNAGTFAPDNIGPTIGLAAPVVLAALAVTPTLLVGNGGIDLSVGPVMGLVNVLVVYELIGRAGVDGAVPGIAVALGAGLAAGLVNGVLVAYLRIQPIVATLGTYLIAAGLTLALLSTPGGTTPGWLDTLSGGASVIPILVVLAAWAVFVRRPVYERLMATGGDERAAFTSGIDTTRVRIVAYAIGGLIAGVAGIALSAVLGSADPTVGPSYTLTGIAAAALGGVSLAGGRGGMLRALVGALTIFLLQNLLTYLHTSPFLLQVAYGAVLVAAVAINGQADALLRRFRHA